MLFLYLTDDELIVFFRLLFYLGYVDNLFPVLFYFSYFFQGLFSTFIKTAKRKMSLLMTQREQINRFVNASKFR